MRNIVGQPVSGTDFFPREVITRLIYRRIDTGSHLYMTAPRRVGKTSIMFKLRDQPKEGYTFIYVATESVNSSELYFERLFEALLNSKVISMKVKASVKSKGLFEKIKERVNKVKAFGVEIAVAEKEKESYADVFLDLMKKLDNSAINIVIMIDEFPSTIENIHQKSGKVAAVHFLKQNRTIRQESAGGIQFVYTGSIGLSAVVNRLNTPESINDLNTVEISPLSNEEGKSFAEQLLKSANVPYQSDAIDYLLERINWLMPFFIQLSVQQLIDLFDKNQTEVSKEVVDEAFENICKQRNNTHFDSYYNRLEDAFSEADYKLALKILNLVAAKNSISENDLSNNLNSTGSIENLNPIIESLIYDGYINLREGYYRFNSPILQLWWNKYGRRL